MSKRAAVDAQAFLQLYDRYIRQVYGYFSRRTDDRHTAEVLTSQLFLKLLQMAFTRLTCEERDLLALRYSAQLSFEEIGSATGRNPSCCQCPNIPLAGASACPHGERA